jgi:hypothetical protein
LPQLNELAVAADLVEPRWYAAVTALADGRVLVAGGMNSGSVASVEIYDPELDSWTQAPPLATAGYDRQAVLLSDGDVLVVGRFEAERLDLQAGVWSLTGPRVAPGNPPSAILLPSGKVLVVTVDGAEIFDAASDQWSATGSMNAARSGASLTLLSSGQVLTAGGHDTVAGGTNTGILASAEIYDPETNTWTATGSMHWPRRRHVAVILGSGEVLVAGGDEGELELSSSELYDPVSGTWRLTRSDMTVPRHRAAALQLASGEVILTGGSDGSAALASTEVYEPTSETWRPGPTLARSARRAGRAYRQRFRRTGNDSR